MKKVLKKYELHILGNNELFIYKGQKYKLQRSKKEPPTNPDTLRCIKLNDSNSYAESVFLHWKTIVECYVWSPTEKERIEEFQNWENEHLWHLEQRTEQEAESYKSEEDKSWSDYEPEDMWDDE